MPLSSPSTHSGNCTFKHWFGALLLSSATFTFILLNVSVLRRFSSQVITTSKQEWIRNGTPTTEVRYNFSSLANDSFELFPKDVNTDLTESMERIQILEAQEIKKLGLDPVENHSFKSPYITNPMILTKELSDLWAKTARPHKPKVISFYNIGVNSWFRIQAENVNNPLCKYKCEMDLVGKRAAEADILIYLCKSMTSHPVTRPPGQLWAVACYESSRNWGYPEYNFWKDKINITLGHRLDSSIPNPYVKLRWRDPSLLLKQEEYRKIAENKTKTAAWFVSNCQHDRLNFVKAMQKYIDIDIYGNCGKILNCHTAVDDYPCRQMLNTTYKFYLAFENSFCKDYVTEKFQKAFSDRTHVIQVVKGALDYEKYFPPNTFVNGNQFEDAKDLALYLKELAGDIPRYTKMLQEKDMLEGKKGPSFHDWCSLCEMFHTKTFIGHYRDIGEWSHGENSCKSSEYL